VNTKEKEKLCKEFNISLPTFYSWEKNKPRLIELIKLGLEYENLQEDHEVITKKQKKEIEETLDIIPEMLNTINKINERLTNLENK